MENTELLPRSVPLSATPVGPEAVVEIRLQGDQPAVLAAAKRLADAGLFRLTGSKSNRGGSGSRVYGVLLV